MYECQNHHQYCSKIRVKDLNQHLMCVLCGGYFVDATTIIECLHSFCRSCIIRYLESSKYCPICDVQVHKTRPLLNIRSDKTLQDMVYKLIPGLFDEEMRRRREFLKGHPEVKIDRMDLEQRGLAMLVPVHSLPDQKISLVLHMATHNGSTYSETKRTTASSKKAGDRKYLLCPSDVTIGILKKFLQCKFNLSDKYQVDLFYAQREEVISDDFTLLDVTFIYSWNREKPLSLFYSVYEKPRRKRRLMTDRLLKLQCPPAKRARMELPEHNGSAVSSLPYKSSEKPSSRTDLPAPKKRAVGRPVSKVSKMVVSQSFQGNKQKVKMKKTDFWKLHRKENLKAKTKKSLENAKKVGRGRKRVLSPPRKTDRLKRVGRPAGSKSKTNANSLGSHLPNGRPEPKRKSGTPSPSRNGLDDSKMSGSSSDSPYRPGKPSMAALARSGVNGMCRPAVRPSQDSRSASPRLSTPGSSRSSSPRLTSGASSRAGSKHCKVGSARESGTCSRKDGRATGGSRPGSRGSSRADSPRPAHPLHTIIRDRLSSSSLPLDQKISVDVTMITSSASETSSDVTSPGAEDRSHSTGLEEPGDFHHSDVCNVASRPLSSLLPVQTNNAHRHSAEKGGRNKHAADTGNSHKQNGNKGGSESQLSKGKTNSHKQNRDKSNNGVKHNANKNTERKEGMNGHTQGMGMDCGNTEGNKSQGNNKQGFHKCGPNKEPTKTTKAPQLHTKTAGKTPNKKR